MLEMKILMMCWEVVFKNDIVLKVYFMLYEKYIVQFSDDVNVLIIEDRCKLLVKYNLEVYVFLV